MAELHYKDEVLNTLAESYNVAQFVSFGPNGMQRFSRVSNHEPNHVFEDILSAVHTLMERSCGSSLNIRSFDPEDPQSKPFIYGILHLEEVLDSALSLMEAGFHIIIHETVDVNDGGVSGVMEGGIMEFAPGVTPRAVENIALPSLPNELGLSILRTVYGGIEDLEDFIGADRVEFSVHPRTVGFKMTHVIVWELQETNRGALPSNIYWPNPFSKMLGDKAFGLLVADLYGYNVPQTTVHMRKHPIKTFSFGTTTKTDDFWTRTCPSCQTPGRFTTVHAKVDPRELMHADDPAGILIPSCLIQEGVQALWSGALVTGSDGLPIVQGTQGYGDTYMLGFDTRIVPDHIAELVKSLYLDLAKDFRANGFEWVYDGNRVWVVQLHIGATRSKGNTIVPSNGTEIKEWIEFNPHDGLTRLHEVVALAMGMQDAGIRITGPVGMTSHVADVLRKANIPSEIRC